MEIVKADKAMAEILANYQVILIFWKNKVGDFDKQIERSKKSFEAEVFILLKSQEKIVIIA